MFSFGIRIPYKYSRVRFNPSPMPFRPFDWLLAYNGKTWNEVLKSWAFGQKKKTTQTNWYPWDLFHLVKNANLDWVLNSKTIKLQFPSTGVEPWGKKNNPALPRAEIAKRARNARDARNCLPLPDRKGYIYSELSIFCFPQPVTRREDWSRVLPQKRNL